METNIIYNVDCLDIFPKIDDKSIDCVICDLSYGTTAATWGRKHIGIKKEPSYFEIAQKRIADINGR